MDLEQVKKNIQEAGPSKLHILADFDKTMTYAHTKDGKPLPSVISVIRDHDYLSLEYSAKAKALFEKYHPMENDTSIPLKKRKEAMRKWWTTHFKLLIESGLKESDLGKIVASDIIRLREGAEELFGYLNKRNIPLVIMSSSGIGNTIPMILRRNGLEYDNVYVITNIYEFDSEGKALRVSEPIIHTMNKDETAIQGYPAYRAVKDRPNVLLLGDSLGDSEMAKGLEIENILKVGFLNGDEDKRQSFEDAFDMVIAEDTNLNQVNELVKELT